MLNEDICKLRDKLNDSILSGDDYSVTYKLSVELDELIAQYYRINTKKDCIEKNTKKIKANEIYV